MSNLATHSNVMRLVEPRDAAEPQDFVVRARSEVLRMLDAIQTRQIPLTITFLSVSCVLPSSLIYVDDASNTLLMACPPDWETACSEGGDAIMIGCVFEDAKVEFQCGSHALVDLDGTPVVGFPIPEFIWRFQRRRDPRYKVAGLQIVLNFGFLDAEAEVIDISLGGIGMVNCNEEIQLEVGEMLPNCAIRLPGVGEIAVDLQVQRLTKTAGHQGQSMTQVGCQITGLPEAKRQMLAHFLDGIAGK